MESDTASDKEPENRMIQTPESAYQFNSHSVHELRAKLSHPVPMNRCREPLSLIIKVDDNNIIFANLNFWSGQTETQREITATYAVSDNTTFVEAVSDVALGAFST